MGKAQKSRKHAVSARSTADPTSTAAVAAAMHAAAQAAPQAEHIAQNQQLYEKLAGTDVQKAVACSGLAHIIANQLRPATSVLTTPLLRRLLPLLLERSSYDVAISAAGALRNISAIANASENAKGNPVLSLLLNADACTIAIKLLEADQTHWILALPAAPAHAEPVSGTAGLIPHAPADKRFHFLTQVISALANLSEQFDVVLGYLTANSLAMQHLLMMLLDRDTMGASGASFHGVALQVEISNLLLLVSEQNAEFARALSKLPPGFGGVNGIITKLMQRIDPASGEAAASPQVRAHCAGILLNLQSSPALMSLASSASAGLTLPGTPNAVPTSGEQLCVTSILSTISSVLDVDPLALGEELVLQLRRDRAAVDAQLADVEKARGAEDVKYKQMAEERHAAKMAAKARAAAGAGAAAGEASMEDDSAAEQKNAPAVTAAAPQAVEEAEMTFADESDAMESTHKDASGPKHSNAASSKKSPEVLIASQWSQHLEENLQKYRQYLLAVRISLELLTNLCSSSEEEEDISDSDSDAGSSSLDASQLGYIPKMILHLGVIGKIVNKCHLHLNPDLMKTTNDTAATTPAGPPSLHAALSSIFPAEEVSTRIVELIDEIRNRCINCLNNMVLYLPKEVLPGAELGQLFTYACGLVSELATPYQKNVPLAVEEISNLTSLLFQLARKDTKQVPCNKDVVMMLVQLGRTANVTGVAAVGAPSKYKVQLHVIGLLSLIGTKPESFPYNFVLGSVLLEVVKHAGTTIAAASAASDAKPLHINSASDETHFLECASEALNAIIDVYSEDDIHVDQQKSLGMVTVLEQFMPLFTTAIKVIKQQKTPKVPRQLIVRLEENALNTKEFVKYKKNHL